MNRFTTLLGLAALFLAPVVWADVPKLINFQGILSDAGGDPLGDSTVNVQFTIYDSPGGSTSKWSETQSISTDSAGQFSIILGTVSPIPDTAFAGAGRYLGIKVESDPEMTPRQQLVSIPYAYEFDDSGPDSAVVYDVVSSSAGLATGFLGKASGATTGGSIYGVRGLSENASTGGATGGYFATLPAGTGPHFGLYGLGQGASAGETFGVYGSGVATGSGPVYGGSFSTFSGGSGTHYGVYGSANGSDTVYGNYGYAICTSSDPAYGGYFNADSGGTGVRYGVYGTSTSSSAAAAAIGSFGLGKHTSTQTAYGVYGNGQNTSSGAAIGGYFIAPALGTGEHYGSQAFGNGSSASATYGSYAYATNSGAGTKYGGYFEVPTGGGLGPHYGVFGDAKSASAALTLGVFGDANNTSTGTVYGGQFLAGNGGAGATGVRYGIHAQGLTAGTGDAYGCYARGASSSSGTVYGGYFTADFSATGTHYGVYGVETAGGSGAAVYASGDFAGSGAKYAVCKTSQGHRLMSVIEAPEVLFEDFGEGKLFKGKVHIGLDPLFLETVTINTQNPMKVFIQLEDDCEGVYVKKFNSGFDVIELQNGTSNSSFSYRIVAKRKGYENQRLKQTDVGMEDPNLYPELWAEMEKRHQEEQAQRELENQRLEEQRLQLQKPIMPENQEE